MAPSEATRIQLCGRLHVQIRGRQVTDALPGAKGRLLFTFLVLNRHRRISREELLTAVYGDAEADEHHGALSVVLSKLRAAVGADVVAGRTEFDLRLPRDAFVDVEAALESLHRAESHVAMGEWAEAWGPAGVAYHVASRPLLQESEAAWLDRWRRRLEDVRVRGLECFARARLGLGGPALPQAEQCARLLIELSPYRESAYGILMETLEQRGNIAEALLIYEQLRVMLRDELGVAPAPAIEAIYRRLLRASARSTL